MFILSLVNRLSFKNAHCSKFKFSIYFNIFFHCNNPFYCSNIDCLRRARKLGSSLITQNYKKGFLFLQSISIYFNQFMFAVVLYTLYFVLYTLNFKLYTLFFLLYLRMYIFPTPCLKNLSASVARCSIVSLFKRAITLKK